MSRDLLPASDIIFEPVKGGIHAGGQHAQKNSTGVRATHIPTGTVIVIRGRSLAMSKRRAIRAIRNRLRHMKLEAQAAVKKERRDYLVHNTRTIRTYDRGRSVVTDHRTGKKASWKNIVEKGRLELLQE